MQNYADIGADQITFGMLSSTMPIEVAVEAVETFGKHVIPQFDKDPVHSTSPPARSAVRVGQVLTGRWKGLSRSGGELPLS